MRAIFPGLIFAAVAGPAAAQAYGPINPLEFDHLRAQQQAAERRAIDQANQLMALEARLRADQADLDLRQQRQPPGAPALRFEPAYRTPTLAAKYPSVPDSALADSNRKVQAAANRR